MTIGWRNECGSCGNVVESCTCDDADDEDLQPDVEWDDE